MLADARHASEIEDPAYFHVMGCSLMANDALRERIIGALEVLHAKGAKISFDPNIRPELLGERSIDAVVGPVLARCHVLLPGTAELALLSGCQTTEAGVRRLFDTTPLEIIVVKRGKAGCTVYTRNGAVDGPAYAVSEVDPTGAGDCFDAGFLCGLLEGRSLLESAQVAAAAGALNAGAFGLMEGKITRSTVAEVMAMGAVT